MRTTLDLNEKLIRELMDVTSAKTKTDAIHQAASELIRRKKLDQLKSLSGKIRLDLDWRKLEQTEIRHQASLKRRRHGHRCHLRLDSILQPSGFGGENRPRHTH